MKRVARIQLRRTLRRRRSRARVFGTREAPRIAVFRSNRYFSVQLIDDAAQRTLVGCSTRGLSEGRGRKTERAAKLGELVARRAKELGISRAVLHRGHYRYHGQVRAFVEEARRAGLHI